MIPSLKKSFANYYRHPFIFIWASFIYVALQMLFIFAAAGIFIIHFFLASVIGLQTGITQIPTIVVGALVLLLLGFFSSGLIAGLLHGYSNALEGRKTTVAEFMRHSFQKSAMMFVLMLMRGVLLLLVAGPVIALYIYYLSDIEFMDILAGLYIFSAFFLVDFLFTPAFVSAGAFGTGLFMSLRNGASFLRRKHVNAFGLYVVYAIVWLLNFVPLMQLFSLFVLLPVVYPAFIVMFQGVATARQR